MAFDTQRAVVATGQGIVARFPGVVCVARCADAPPVRQLLALCADTSGSDPGRVLARRLATWLSGPDAPGERLAFGTLAAAGDQLAVFLVGPVEARVDGPDGAVLSGVDAAIGTDRLLPRPSAPVVLSVGEATAADDAADVLDLRRGVVGGAGVVLHPHSTRDDSDPSRPDAEPAWAADAPARAVGEPGLATDAPDRSTGDSGWATDAPNRSSSESGRLAGAPDRAASQPGWPTDGPDSATGDSGWAADAPDQATAEPEWPDVPHQATGEPGWAADVPDQVTGEPEWATDALAHATVEPERASGGPDRRTGSPEAAERRDGGPGGAGQGGEVAADGPDRSSVAPPWPHSDPATGAGGPARATRDAPVPADPPDRPGALPDHGWFGAGPEPSPVTASAPVGLWDTPASATRVNGRPADVPGVDRGPSGRHAILEPGPARSGDEPPGSPAEEPAPSGHWSSEADEDSTFEAHRSADSVTADRPIPTRDVPGQRTGPPPDRPATDARRMPSPVRRPPAVAAPGAPVEISGYLCEQGHLSDPRAPFCGQCGAPVDDRAGLVTGVRPVLGRLRFDDGATYPVDDGLLIGRLPESDDRVRTGALRPVIVEDPMGSVSRVHAEIRLDGWDVMLYDAGSRNGTYVAGPEESAWVPLPPERGRRLLPGTRVRLGGRTFVFDSSSGLR